MPKDIISAVTVKGNIPAIRYYTQEKVEEIMRRGRCKEEYNG